MTYNLDRTGRGRWVSIATPSGLPGTLWTNDDDSLGFDQPSVANTDPGPDLVPPDDTIHQLIELHAEQGRTATEAFDLIVESLSDERNRFYMRPRYGDLDTWRERRRPAERPVAQIVDDEGRINTITEPITEEP